MAERRPMFRYALVDGEPTAAGGVRVTPQSRVLEIRWRHGGLVWNRPVAVIVEREGQRTRTPIVDATRVAQVVLGVLAAFVSAGAAARMARRRGRRDE